MPGVIENLKRGVSTARSPTPAAIVADITEKLQAAETSLADLEAKRDAASLDAWTDAPGGKDALAKLNAEASDARSKIETLKAAHRAAVAREQEASREIRRDAIRHAVSRVRAHLKARDEAAADFAKAAEALCAAYAKIYEADEKARTAHQIGNIGPWPIEAFGNSELQRLAAGCLWKFTPTKKGEVIAGLALPGAHFPALEYQNWPEGVPDLVATFEANSASVLALIAPKVPA